MNNDEKFKDRLNELLKRKGLSITEAAKKAKISKKNLHNWSAGVLSTDYEGLSRLAEVLETSLEFLMIGKTPKVKKLNSIDELYIRSQPLFDGLCEVTIRPLLPRKKVSTDE